MISRNELKALRRVCEDTSGYPLDIVIVTEYSQMASYGYVAISRFSDLVASLEYLFERTDYLDQHCQALMEELYLGDREPYSKIEPILRKIIREVDTIKRGKDPKEKNES